MTLRRQEESCREQMKGHTTTGSVLERTGGTFGFFSREKSDMIEDFESLAL
jgi:hypothetical protein